MARAPAPLRDDVLFAFLLNRYNPVKFHLSSKTQDRTLSVRRCPLQEPQRKGPYNHRLILLYDIMCNSFSALIAQQSRVLWGPICCQFSSYPNSGSRRMEKLILWLQNHSHERWLEDITIPAGESTQPNLPAIRVIAILYSSCPRFRR